MSQIGEPTLCLLFRCNRPHGEHINRLDDNHFIGYHIHIAKYEYISSGLKSDKYAELTHEYATFDDALAFFLEKCNVVNASEYFNITKAEIDNKLELFKDGSSSDPDKKTI